MPQMAPIMWMSIMMSMTIIIMMMNSKILNTKSSVPAHLLPPTQLSLSSTKWAW